MESSSDNDLIYAYLEGNNPQAFDLLTKRYLKNVYNFVFGLSHNTDEAEDITQETFVKAWKNLKKFDRDKSFKNWIFSIAKNTAVDYFRKKKPSPFSFFENEEGENRFLDSVSDATPLADEIFEQYENKKKLAKAINDLPILYRSIAVLRFSENLKFEEIAEIFGESVNTIKSRARRAEGLIKKSLHWP